MRPQYKFTLIWNGTCYAYVICFTFQFYFLFYQKELPSLVYVYWPLAARRRNFHFVVSCIFALPRTILSALWWTMESLQIFWGNTYVTGFRRLFYIVSPNETIFETEEEVPKYVNEVSWMIKMTLLITTPGSCSLTWKWNTVHYVCHQCHQSEW